MHEMSLVKSLLAQVQSIVTNNGAESANEVLIEIGPLSGVETELVQSAFAQATQAENVEMKLLIDNVPLMVRCRECQHESRLDDFVFRCLACHSGCVQVIRGDEVRLVSVTLNEVPSHA